ncbi:hypothetical protein OIU79_005880 [Salix purpurea]|uniref:Uncharacterized protein n=1 Tax=Salix purpurea TaxID=77065 RepID=A0A9Q0TU52_SALPP|nr:hypothetical protein OIU79_005880 [Salix purpurea]
MFSPAHKIQDPYFYILHLNNIASTATTAPTHLTIHKNVTSFIVLNSFLCTLETQPNNIQGTLAEINVSGNLRWPRIRTLPKNKYKFQHCKLNLKLVDVDANPFQSEVASI